MSLLELSLSNMNRVDEYILDQDPELAIIVEKLRDIIKSCSPSITEKIAYRIPFYYGYKRLFYINVVKEVIDFAFCRGNELSNVQNILKSKGRKSIKSISIKSINDIDEEVLSQIISEAILLDEEYKKAKTIFL